MPPLALRRSFELPYCEMLSGRQSSNSGWQIFAPVWPAEMAVGVLFKSPARFLKWLVNTLTDEHHGRDEGAYSRGLSIA